MWNLCCMGIVIFISVLLISLLVLKILWNRFTRRFGKKKTETRIVYDRKSGSPVVDVSTGTSTKVDETKDPGERRLVERPGLAPSPPEGKKSHTFMYSSMSYSTANGKRWGKVVVTEKDGERTVKKYGDMVGEKKNEGKKLDEEDYVDI
jgi:hypothetical protein